MLQAFRGKIWYVWLLPLFFVLHGLAENFGFIGIPDLLVLLFTYLVASTILYMVCYVFFRESQKAALFAFFLFSFYLFFGTIQDFLQLHFKVVNRYSFLLSFSFVLFVAFFIYLKKNKSHFSKTNLFLNCLLCIYFLVDTITIAVQIINPPTNKLSIYSPNNEYRSLLCDTCTKPDIYLLLFDEYASTFSLKKHFNYDNLALDNFLIRQGFHIQQSSKSNYNFTPFSIASILNMSYLKGIDPPAISMEDYARCNALISKNKVTDFVSAQGYEVVNYSIFDLAGHPTMFGQNLLPYKTRLLTSATLFQRMQKDLGWMLITGKFEMPWLTKDILYTNRNINEQVKNSVIRSSGEISKTPKFYYCHFFLPHPPFYFTSEGLPKSPRVIRREWDDLDTNAYLQYVAYTNLQVSEIITSLKKNTKGNAVIIFMGDHGFRKHIYTDDQSNYFENQNAVYLPSGNYDGFYIGASGVNQFRIIFNTLFSQNFPLLKDSTVFLTDKK